MPASALTQALVATAAVVAYLALLSTSFAMGRNLRWARLLSWVGATSFGLFVLQDSTKTDLSDVGILALLQVGVPLALVLPTVLTHPIHLDSVASRPLGILAAMFAWIVLTLPAALSPVFSLGNTIQALVGLLLAVRIVSLYPGSALLLRDLVLASAALSSLAIMEAVLAGVGLGILDPANLDSAQERLTGSIPYVHSNELSFVAALGVLTGLGLWRSSSQDWTNRHLPRRVLFPVTALLAATCIATWTRSTMAVMTTGLILTYAIGSRGKNAALRWSLVGLAALFAGLVLRSSMVEALLYRGQSVDAVLTLNSRTTWWAEAVSAVGVPLTGEGAGLGGHRLASSELVGVGNLDSTWVALLVNGGWVAAVLFAGFWLSLVMCYWRAPRALRPVLFGVLFPSFLVTLYNPSIQDLNYIGVFSLVGCLSVARGVAAADRGETLDSGFWADAPYGMAGLETRLVGVPRGASAASAGRG